MYDWLYISVPCACNSYSSQERASDPLELELQMLVSCYMGAGN